MERSDAPENTRYSGDRIPAVQRRWQGTRPSGDVRPRFHMPPASPAGAKSRDFSLCSGQCLVPHSVHGGHVAIVARRPRGDGVARWCRGWRAARYRTIRAYDGLGDVTRGGGRRTWTIIEVGKVDAPSHLPPFPREPAASEQGLQQVRHIVNEAGGRLATEQRVPGNSYFVLQLPSIAAQGRRAGWRRPAVHAANTGDRLGRWCGHRFPSYPLQCRRLPHSPDVIF